MRLLIVLAIAWLAVSPASAEGGIRSFEEWSSHSPREEIRPLFAVEPGGGPDEPVELVIGADQREGLSGHWRREFSVRPEQHYRFTVLRKTDGMGHPRRSAVARLIWVNEKGDRVLRGEPTELSYRPGERPRAEPEFPALVRSRDGWDELEGLYAAPPAATKAVVELHFRWGPPQSSVRWTVAKLTAVEPPGPNLVRLATVHYRPREGETAMEKREQFAPLIRAAAEQNADLVVLPESLTYYKTKGGYAAAAEPIPGPSTDYFAALAKQHDLYIVAGLLERDRHLIYNVAVLLGPSGTVVGKYRKVCLPRSEIEGGVTPGDEYPVFQTRFGKVGMMVCYDGFFPEVARELANGGADVIAWPVWGCNPLLASARACENHVYVVSSTYTERSNDWMLSAIYDHAGRTLDVADEWGTIAIAEVDLSKPSYWHSLGDFRAQLPAHRPVIQSE